MTLKGFDDFEKELKKMRKAADKLEETDSVSFHELFTAGFMGGYTNFSTIDEFFENGGFSFSTAEEFEKIPQEVLDQHVAKTTRFSSWEEMLGKAYEQFVSKQLGF